MTCCKSANVELPHFDVEKELKYALSRLHRLPDVAIFLLVERDDYGMLFDCFTLRFTLFDAESSTL